VLPLDHGTGRTIAVIGHAASPVGAASNSGGGGSSKGSGVPSPVSPLEGIERLAAAHGDRVVYADGSSQVDAQAAAAAADVAIVFAADTASEGSDRQDLALHPGACLTLFCGSLPIDQEAMIGRAAAANDRTVVVLDAGAPVQMPWLGDVAAVLDAFYPGIENGNAIASILYGEANPSGKLPQTFPKTLGDMPARTQAQYPGTDGKAVYSEGLQVGYRWFDAQGIAPLFPFGYGLSYTTFRYGDLSVAPQRDGARVQFTLANTGRRPGAEIGQVYVGFPAADGEPPRQLKGFEKVALEPGEARTVTVDLEPRAFQHWSTERSGWVATPGCYTVAVGSSSRDLPLQGAVPVAGGSCGAAAKTKRCRPWRTVALRLRGVRARQIRRVSITVNGARQRARRRHGRRLVLRVTGDAQGVARVRAVVRTKRGGKRITRRTFRLCGAARRA
jgi:beta-glucosidase